MRVSSFKAQYRQAPARSVTPPPPAYEPISPVLAPSDLPAAAPSSAKDNITQEGHDASSPALQERSGNGRRENTSLRLSPSPATSEKPFQAASLPPSNVYQPPALRSPIETLANAAVSTFDTKSVYAEHSRRPSQTPFFSPAAATSRPGPSEHAPQHAYPEPSSAYSERPSKRARSEHFPQSARPATSHNPGWSYNVEQMADRGVGTYQLDAAASYHQQESQMKRLSDAELLLNFAISAPYSLQNSHSPTAKRWSFSHAQTLQQQSAPQPNGVQPAVHYKDLKVDNAAPSDRRYSLHSAEAGANSAGVSNPIRPPVQIHTPPEDPLGAPVPISTGVPNDPEKKLKKSQGWPKGKPRGSRNGTTTERKRKPVIKQGHIPANVSNGAPSAAQLHSPQSPLADGQEGHQYGNAGLSVPSAQAPAALQRRRLSYPYAAESDMRVSTAGSRSPRAHSVPPPTAMAATPLSDDAINFDTARSHDASQVTICAGCHSTDSLTSIGDGEQWISCDGCKEWFHYACVGFKSEREVRVIDKFYCEGCRPKFGNTTSEP
jgi:F-box/leucine-rich repeat protein 10/11